MAVADAMQVLADDLFAIYSRAGREVTYVTESGDRRPYWANRYMQALKRAVDEEANGTESAVIDFVERLVMQPEPSRGFFYLQAAKRLDLTVEAHVIDALRPYHSLFSAQAVDASRKRLADYGYERKDAATEGPAVPDLLVLHYDVLADRTKSSLERLSSSKSLRANLDSFDLTLVRDARAAGAAWSDVALRLGVSEEGAIAHFGIKRPNGEVL
jgi:hypothetical protein